MTVVSEGDLMWTPDAARIARSNVTRYMNWLEANRGLSFGSYDELWRWSTTETETFWASIWDYIDVQSDCAYTAVTDSLEMKPGNRWYIGSRVNFAEHVLRALDPAAPALQYLSELRPLASLSGRELASRVRVLGTRLRAMGVAPGDRVCALMPNVPETVVAMLAAISIGAVWANAAPEFGQQPILDRFAQVEPKVLFVVDGYRYGGKDHDRREMVGEIVGKLGSVRQVVYLRNLFPTAPAPSANWHYYEDLLTGEDPGPANFRFERLACDDPLWVVFSSGTTGLPSAARSGHCQGQLPGGFGSLPAGTDLCPLAA